MEIYRYVTEGTFDSYLFQLVEQKQRFISQIMTGKSPVRSAEDVDEATLSYAEIKMLATGDPNIKEKMDLDMQVSKLRLLKSAYLTEKYALEDKILKEFPSEITRLTNIQKGLEEDIGRAADHPRLIGDKFCGITVKDVFYAEKGSAGEAILEVCRNTQSAILTPIGEYRGFGMELSYDAFEKVFNLHLHGTLSYPVTLGKDGSGNITRLDNALGSLSKRLELTGNELESTRSQLETAKIAVQRPFDGEDELAEKSKRLIQLNALLKLDKKDNEIVSDNDPAQGLQDRAVYENPKKGMRI